METVFYFEVNLKVRIKCKTTLLSEGIQYSKIFPDRTCIGMPGLRFAQAYHRPVVLNSESQNANTRATTMAYSSLKIPKHHVIEKHFLGIAVPIVTEDSCFLPLEYRD